MSRYLAVDWLTPDRQGGPKVRADEFVPGVLRQDAGRAGRRRRHGTGGQHTMTANSFGSRAALKVGEAEYEIHRLDAVPGAASLPFSLKILLENLLRTEDGHNVTREHI